MTALGKFLDRKSISKASIARKTGISRSRLTQLTLHESTKLKASELYLIALAIDVSPNEIAEALYGNLKLKE